MEVACCFRIMLAQSFLLAAVWTCVALLVRLGVLVLTHWYSLTAGFGGFYPLASGADDRYYYEAAVQLSKGLGMPTLPNAYPWLLSLPFALFGPNIILGKALNVLLGSLGVGVAVLIAEKLASSRRPLWSLVRPANLVGVFLTFYPSGVFYSTQLLKDALVWFLGLLGLYFSIPLITSPPRFRHYIALGVVLVFLWALRPYTALALVGAVGTYLIFWRLQLRHLALLGLLLLVVPWLLGWGPFGWSYLSPLLSPERLAAFRAEVYGIGGSSLGIELDPAQPLQFVLGWFYSALTVFIGPFPWQLDAPIELIAFLEVIYLWPLVAVWGAGLSRLRNPGPPEFLLLFALILGFGIGLFSGNLGANTRLRLLVWGSLIIYAAVWLGGNRAHTVPHHPSRARGGPDASSGAPEGLPGQG